MNRRDVLRYGAVGLVAAAAPRRRARAAEIVRCVIHPAIGVARVGNSPDEFSIGPETPGQPPAPAGGPGTAVFSGEDGWQDDVSDGPVEATVRLGGRVFEATGAWVVVGPPNYAPGIPSIVTMYDLIFEVATRLAPARAPARPSFTRQIYPLFERHVRNQWVNAGFAREFGWGAPDSFLAPALLARLADPSSEQADVRRALFQRFRDPAYARMQPSALPPYYGDNTQLVPETPRQWMAVLPIQYEWLRQWAEGDFDADWPAEGLRYPSRVEDLPVVEQPAALDRAALDECLGGLFHPGCELTWPMRIASLYEAPFRLRRRTGPEPDWGEAMTSAIALAPAGPLAASGPGDLTRWMAVPWQVDTASCLSAYQPEDEYLPAFWPARVPNDLLAATDYATVLDAAADAQRRQRAFRERRKWLRPLPLGQFSAETRVNAFLRERMTRHCRLSCGSNPTATGALGESHRRRPR